MNKKIFLLSCLLLVLVLTACSSSSIDSKNEEILLKVISLEDIAVNKVSILDDVIFVSLDVALANQYDTQLLEWWGTIFSFSTLLSGDYEVVIIENVLNDKPQVYVSSNMFSINDYINDKITDIQFWEESLISSDKPSTKEILLASGLPSHALSYTNQTANPINIKKLLIILISSFLVAGLLFVAYSSHIRAKKKHKQSWLQKLNMFFKNLYHKTLVPTSKNIHKKAKKSYKETLVPKAKELSKSTQKHSKKLLKSAKKTKDKGLKKLSELTSKKK
jgi:hypothetical protein